MEHQSETERFSVENAARKAFGKNAQPFYTESNGLEHFCESCMSDKEPFCTEHISEIREEYNRKTSEDPNHGEHIRGIREEEKPFS